MTNKKIFFALLTAAVMCVPFTMNAQITIGSGNPPSEWSLLDLDNREQEQPKALHLPRMTTAERDLLLPNNVLNLVAKGLMIFRTDAIRIGSNEYLGCLEFWNGAQWISLCEGYRGSRRGCGAYIAPGVWREFMCHNLGADTSLDPFTPHPGLHGASFKWGTGIYALCGVQNLVQSPDLIGTPDWAGRGGTPPQASTAHWCMETRNPCPPGFRVPTREEWQGVVDNNPARRVGINWHTGNLPYPTGNFSSGIFLGDYLFLPAAGSRTSDIGRMSTRGSVGWYRSTCPSGVTSYGLRFTETWLGVTTPGRTYGHSVRCIAE